MDEITLQALLEAGCHFGHKAERWHPKAASFIYTKKDGVHIIDLAKTKAGLEAAAEFVKNLVAGGGEVLFVATKRQAKGVLKEEATTAGAPYFSERWIGGFLTNWDSVKKNIEKINRLTEELASGAWNKYPKHERVKLARYLERIKIYYGGVLTFTDLPAALFIIDVKKEDSAVREAQRREIPIVAVVDTNANPEGINYVIPANDDAVGSIQYITHIMLQAYKEGKEARIKGNSESGIVNQKDAKTGDTIQEAPVEEKKKKPRTKKNS